MVKYFQAGTNIVGLPKEMVFIDKSNNPHLYPSLTPKHHIATHYGHSAIETAYNPRGGNLLKITRGQYTDYAKKVKKQSKAAKALANATASVETAAKRMRGRPRKNLAIIDNIVSSAIGAVTTVPKAKGRARLTDEVKAARALAKAQVKADKATNKELLKQIKEGEKLEKQMNRQIALIEKKKKADLKKKAQ